jgi:hypothetical protein
MYIYVHCGWYSRAKKIGGSCLQYLVCLVHEVIFEWPRTRAVIKASIRSVLRNKAGVNGYVQGPTMVCGLVCLKHRPKPLVANIKIKNQDAGIKNSKWRPLPVFVDKIKLRWLMIAKERERKQILLRNLHDRKRSRREDHEIEVETRWKLRWLVIASKRERKKQFFLTSLHDRKRICVYTCIEWI